MFEDYVAGALLLIAGWASYRARPWERLFLVVAWAYVTGMMSGSFWSQLEDTLRHTIAEPNNLLVLSVKFLFWLTAVVSLVLSFKRSSELRST